MIAVEGNYIGDIGSAIQEYAEGFGYSVVREWLVMVLVNLFMNHLKFQNYGFEGKGQILKEGLVIAIEPMINIRKKRNIIS